MTFKTKTGNFKYNMMAELSENFHMQSILAGIDNPKILRQSVLAFGRRNKNTGNILAPLSVLYLVFG